MGPLSFQRVPSTILPFRSIGAYTSGYNRRADHPRLNTIMQGVPDAWISAGNAFVSPLRGFPSFPDEHCKDEYILDWSFGLI